MRARNIIIGVLGLLVIYLMFIREVEPIKIVDTVTDTDTVTLYDTIRVPYPVPYAVHKTHTDTLYLKDSIPVYVPISEYKFKGSNYDITAQGYKVALTDVSVYAEKQVVTVDRLREITLPPKRLTHGFNVGVGVMYGTKGVDFGIYGGYGLTLKF